MLAHPGKLCLYNPLIELSKCGRNIQHSMLVFQKENTTLQKNNLQGILLTFMLVSLRIFNIFGS